MRGETDKTKLQEFMVALGDRVTGEGTIYLTGGATAVLHNWRDATIDVDLKADPEPPGLFEAIAGLKDELDINVELASPDQFIPAIPGGREQDGLVHIDGLRAKFDEIASLPKRYPAIDPGSFRTAVMEFCDDAERDVSQ